MDALASISLTSARRDGVMADQDVSGAAVGPLKKSLLPNLAARAIACIQHSPHLEGHGHARSLQRGFA